MRFYAIHPTTVQSKLINCFGGSPWTMKQLKEARQLSDNDLRYLRANASKVRLRPEKRIEEGREGGPGQERRRHGPVNSSTPAATDEELAAIYRTFRSTLADWTLDGLDD